MLETIENISIFIVLLAEAYVFSITYIKIKDFRNIFAEANSYALKRVYLGASELAEDPSRILNNVNKYSDNFHGAVPINIITSVFHRSYVFSQIIKSMNTYLIRNRNSVPEFNLVKDIVERNCDALEADINNTISVPLYLGLLGTMIGIIFGLFNISSMSSGSTLDLQLLDRAIPELLGGVKVAMFASFTGLLLTIINSAFFFRRAKTMQEIRKNDFYTFLQIELMPLLNQGINATIQSLQANLYKFNDDFSRNLDKLASFMTKNHDAILAQERVVLALDKMDINTIASANVRVFAEFKKTSESFHLFNEYVQRVNLALQNTNTIIARLTQVVDKTDAVGVMAQNINKSFEENARLIKFFNDHQTSLDSSKQVLSETVGVVSKSLKEAIESMEHATKERVYQMKELMTKEIDKLNSEYPEQWKKLDKLPQIQETLAGIKTSIDKQNVNTSAANDMLIKAINGLSDSVKGKRKVGRIQRAKQWLLSKIG